MRPTGLQHKEGVTLPHELVLIAVRVHLFPSRTQKLSSSAPTILCGRLHGKIGNANTKPVHFGEPVSFCLGMPLGEMVPILGAPAIRPSAVAPNKKQHLRIVRNRLRIYLKCCFFSVALAEKLRRLELFSC